MAEIAVNEIITRDGIRYKFVTRAMDVPVLVATNRKHYFLKYETVAFRHEYSNGMLVERYETHEDALHQHNRVVEFVKKGARLRGE